MSRLSLEQQHQVLGLSEDQYAKLLKKFFPSHDYSRLTFCRAVWSSKEEFEKVLDSIKMETSRLWMSRTEELVGESAMYNYVYEETEGHAVCWSGSVHWRDMHDLKEFIVEKLNEKTPTTPTKVEKKARFLYKLSQTPLLQKPLCAYMGVQQNCCLSEAARAVCDNRDEALLDEWISILNKEDENHIVWRVMNARLKPEDKFVIGGIADLKVFDDFIHGLLSKWKTLCERQQSLIHAYLDVLQEKK